MFEHHHKCSHLLLLVLVENDDRLAVVRHVLCHHRLCVLWHDNSAEEFLNFYLHVINVNISNNDDSLVVWTIPCLVVVAQHFRLEVVYHFHGAYRHAVSVLASRIEGR